MRAGSFAPEFDSTLPHGGMLVKNSAPYESASTSRRVARWHAPTVSPNGALGSLSLLRDRSRAAVRKDGYAKSILEKWTSNIIGTGIKPLSKADDPEFRKASQAKFLQWTDQSDADGLLDFYGQQAQAVHTWGEAGECFARLRLRQAKDGLSVPLQIQILEPELCPYDYNVGRMANGNRVRAGIEFNAIGKRVAYWFYHQRPGDYDDFDAGDLRRVSAEFVIHLYDPSRPGQLRGLPQLSAALLPLFEVNKTNDAVVVRQQLANLFAGFLKQDITTSDQAVNPFTGEEMADGETPEISLEPGVWQVLNPGESVDFSKPPDPPANYADFMRFQLYGAAAASGVPYEVITGDMSKVNDRTVRVILHEFRRRIQALQHQIVSFQFCRRVWQAWLDQAFFSQALPIPLEYVENPEPWARVTWMPQGWPYINPVQDVQAVTSEIRAGLTSRAAAIAERGEDAETVDAEQAADNKRAEALGLIHDSNAKFTSGAGVTQAVPAGSEVVGDDDAEGRAAA